MKEKYILLEDIENLGNAGDVVSVLPGYARNFLVPKKLALKASKGALRQFEARREKIETKRKTEIEKLQQIATKISELKINIPMNVGEDNKLYGSVTSYTVAQAISDLGITIDHNKLILPDTIKELGSYEVKIKLHPEVIATVNIAVVKA
ncbi:MAG TPA: 50S ribosomal protein L9 [Lentisphaeria bacterium]|nr:MAG: 50S ribosomal protein L9 [Lentisphaerae bacterium GWF2_38_69]HBM17152.1 50S ribosomal protein L9 [Lentisphaeria bacterium]